MAESILSILEDVNKKIYWDDYLNEIENGVEEYQKEFKSNNREAEQHLNNILPKYWDVFHTHNTYRRKNEELPKRDDSDETLLPSYDIGIFLVGYSTLPIALSLVEIQPGKQIYFLYSRETEGMLKEIANRIDLILPNYLSSVSVEKIEIKRSSDPVQTFKQIKEIIGKVGDKRIALDLTGGKKTMLGGGFTGGAILGIANSIRSSDCDMFYVDSLEYNPQKRTPTPGTEFLNHLENPYDIYNVQTVAQAEELFYEHNYEAAMHLWNKVQEKLGDHADRYGLQNEQHTVKKNHCMADCYSLWDTFDYVEAKVSKNADGNLWVYDTKHTHNSHHLRIDVLEILSQVPNEVNNEVNAVITAQGEISSDEVRIIHHRTLFADEVRIIHYAIDRYQNGIRRMDSDRSDDAIVRFAQVIEILCLYQIYQIASNDFLCLNSNSVLPDDCLAERWGITGLIFLLFGEDRYRKSKDVYYYIHDMQLKISEYDGYDNATDITDIIDTRHDFVHLRNTPGWRVMEKNAENLEDLARKFLENFSGSYCCANDLAFDGLLDLHRFRQLTE